MLAAAAASPTFAQRVAQQNGGNTGEPPPKLYESLNHAIEADLKKVRLFFSYDCPFGLRYHNGLVSWGASIPNSLKFDAFPIITDANDNRLALAVVGRLIGQAVAPKSLPAYDYMMYTAIQGDPETGAGPTKLSMDAVLKALVNAGASGRDIKQFVRTKGKGIENNLPSHAKIIKTYNLTATPSIAIAGRYVINPDNTQGNPQHMLLMMNGIVSRVVQGDTRAL